MAAGGSGSYEYQFMAKVAPAGAFVVGVPTWGFTCFGVGVFCQCFAAHAAWGGGVEVGGIAYHFCPFGVGAGSVCLFGFGFVGHGCGSNMVNGFGVGVAVTLCPPLRGGTYGVITVASVTPATLE